MARASADTLCLDLALGWQVLKCSLSCHHFHRSGFRALSMMGAAAPDIFAASCLWNVGLSFPDEHRQNKKRMPAVKASSQGDFFLVNGHVTCD